MKKQRIKKILLRGTTGVLALATGLVVAYLITPSKKRTITAPTASLPTLINETDYEETHFDKFVNKVTREVSGDGISGLEASFEDFVISYKKDEKATSVNTIKIDGDLQFKMTSLEDINFVAGLEIDYNGKKMPLLAGFVGKTLYLGVKDIRIKASQTSIDGLLETLEQYYVAADGLDLDVMKIDAKIGNPLADLDLTELLNKFTKKPTEEDPTGVDLKTDTYELPNNAGYRFDLDVKMTTSSTDESTQEVTYKTNNIKVLIDVDKEYNLTRVDVDELEFGTLSVTGAINFEVKPLEVLLPDYDYVGNGEKNHNSPFYNSNYTYYEVVSYDGWLKKLANLLAEDNQKLGLSFDVNMNIDKENKDTQVVSRTELGEIKGSINVDFSELIDLSEFKHDPDYWDDDDTEFEFVDDPYTKRAMKTRDNDEEDSLLNKIKDGLKLGLDLQIFGQNNNLYSNLSLNYEEGDGYLTFNKYSTGPDSEDAVVKVKLDASTVKWMINELPALFKNEANDESNDSGKLFSFITDSEFVKAAKDGDYSGIIDLLTTLRNDATKFEIGVDLSSLGFEGSEVNLTLDSSSTGKTISIDTNDIKIGNFVLDLGLQTEDYQEVSMLDKDVYQSLSFLPGIFDQVTSILDTKRTGFALEGSVLGVQDGLGLVIDGSGQFDYGNKYGYGDLDIKQIKYASNSVDNPWTTHKISLDVRNDKEDKSQNDIKFVYGDINSDSNIKGKITVQTILDIIDVVKELIDSDDERFTKFIDPIMTALCMSAFSDTITNGDYLRFAKNDLIKSIDFSDTGIVVTMGGNLFGLAEGNDIQIKVNFKNVEKNDETLKNIESLETSLIYGTEAEKQKNIHIKLSLKDFDENKLSTIKSYDQTHANAKYMDFTSIKLLLRLGINTTKLGYYNLDATVSLTALNFLNTGDISIGVHILVDGETVKLYGKMELPTVVRMLSRHKIILVGVPKNIITEFSFETYPDGDPNKTNGVGGYFMIKKYIDHSLAKDEYIYYKSTSKNFIDGDNILKYILVGMLDLSDTIVDGIGNIDLGGDSGEKEPGHYTDILPEDGFSFNGNEENPSWSLVLELGKALNIDALKTANVTISGKNGYLAHLDATLEVQASILPLTVSLSADVLNPNPDVHSFPSDIQSSFNELHKASLATVVIERLNQVDNPYESTKVIA